MSTSEAILGRLYDEAPMQMLADARAQLAKRGDARGIVFLEWEAPPDPRGHQINGGIQVKRRDAIRIWLAPEASDYTLAHELAHLHLWIQAPTLQLHPTIPREGSPERITLNALLSAIEHPQAHSILDKYGIDWSAERERKLAAIDAEIQQVRGDSPTGSPFYMIAIGVAEAYLLAPNHPHLAKLDSDLAMRSPRTHGALRSLLDAMDPAMLVARQWRPVFNSIVSTWKIGPNLSTLVFDWADYVRRFW